MALPIRCLIFAACVAILVYLNVVGFSRWHQPGFNVEWSDASEATLKDNVENQFGWPVPFIWKCDFLAFNEDLLLDFDGELHRIAIVPFIVNAIMVVAIVLLWRHIIFRRTTLQSANWNQNWLVFFSLAMLFLVAYQQLDNRHAHLIGDLFQISKVSIGTPAHPRYFPFNDFVSWHFVDNYRTNLVCIVHFFCFQAACLACAGVTLFESRLWKRISAERSTPARTRLVAGTIFLLALAIAVYATDWLGVRSWQ